MGELAVIEARPVPALVSSLADVERVATAMARSGAFGVKDPNTALILCLLAHDEGRSPVAAARDYHVIQGTPAKKADAMLRDFIASGGRVEWHALTDEACSATFTHPAGGSATISWDKARVAQAQLGSNPMHKKYPRQMLRSRVVSEGVRTIYPGATSGLYVPEEVADFDDRPATPPAPQPQRARDLQADQLALADAGRARAEAWVADQIAAIDNASDSETFETIQQGGAKAFAKLGREHPDLRQRVADAYEVKNAALVDANGEKHLDTDMGEGFAEYAAADAKLADILKEIEAAGTIDDLGAVMTARRSDLASLGETRANTAWDAKNRRQAGMKDGGRAR